VSSVRKFNIDFMGHRNIMFGLSLILIVVSIGALTFRGLKFGVEFTGGTVINVVNAQNVTIEDMRKAFADSGITNASVQESTVNGVRGFIVRTDVTDPKVANGDAAKVATITKLPSGDFEVTTIGAGWGKNVTNRALLALGVSILAILLYVSLRFEYKMSITAVIALVHDILITLGIYALVGWEISPNVIAALLAILGYSLYDTIVVFHRIKENSQGLVKQSFMSMANESINEVLVRSLNTTFSSLIPVIVLLFFGGATLKDYALALTIGLAVGAYSSIGVAAPLYAMWKETEPKYAALAKKFAKAS
jgi:SecD/SecF fusion protein